MKIKLAYYAINRERFPGPKATAEVDARITKAQIIISAGEADPNESHIRLGVSPARPLKFRLADGRAVPYYWNRHSWELAPGELKRIKEEIGAIPCCGLYQGARPS